VGAPTAHREDFPTYPQAEEVGAPPPPPRRGAGIPGLQGARLLIAIGWCSHRRECTMESACLRAGRGCTMERERVAAGCVRRVCGVCACAAGHLMGVGEGVSLGCRRGALPPLALRLHRLGGLLLRHRAPALLGEGARLRLLTRLQAVVLL
jgi:hypothetical protein